MSFQPTYDPNELYDLRKCDLARFDQFIAAEWLALARISEKLWEATKKKGFFQDPALKEKKRKMINNVIIALGELRENINKSVKGYNPTEIMASHAKFESSIAEAISICSTHANPIFSNLATLFSKISTKVKEFLHQNMQNNVSEKSQPSNSFVFKTSSEHFLKQAQRRINKATSQFIHN